MLIARAEVGQKLLFPNMYNKTSIAQLQVSGMWVCLLACSFACLFACLCVFVQFFFHYSVFNYFVLGGHLNCTRLHGCSGSALAHDSNLSFRSANHQLCLL